MGYWTFTLANKKITRTKGDYSRSCVLEYGSTGYVCCPDGSFIKEGHYQGYGIFGGHDIYDLVVDWNKEHLVDICRNIPEETILDPYKDAILFAEAYQNGDDAELERLIIQKPFFGDEWKRTLGITIACHDEDNERLPFPIKITSTDHPKLTYKELPISSHCQ